MALDKKQWLEIYRQLARVTPLPVDCGKLCGAKCCTEWESGAGVYLLPGEEEIFAEQGWCKIEEVPPDMSPLLHIKTYILRCSGSCPRNLRPFQCRTFPLAPYMDKSGHLKMIFDENGWLICPLIKLGDMDQLDPKFIAKMKQVWTKLAEDMLIKDYIVNNSRKIDSQKNEPWRKLFQ